MQHYIDVIVARETSCVLLFCSITKSAYDTGDFYYCHLQSRKMTHAIK